MIFFCENNGYAEFSPASAQHAAPLERRAAGYGVDYVAVDGNDVVATATAMHDVVEATRAGRGPVVVEAATYRWHGHYEGDPQRYRSPDEVREWEARDPLLVQRAPAPIGGRQPTTRSSRCSRRSRASSTTRSRRLGGWRRPRPPRCTDFVTRPRPERAEPPAPAADAPVFRTMDAIRAALEAELAGDERVFVAGIDVAAGGNVFGLTRGLHDRFGDRVRDTPISESAIVGLGVGAAMAGMRPVVELMYLDFLGVCLDQLLNQAAKLPFMTGGAAQMALTVRTQFGAGRSSGSQHSQSLEALLAHIPGLSVVMPSTPADTYGLLRAAIQDPNPVVFIENRLLYGMKGPQPPADYILPIGKSIVVRPGSDITVVSVSRMVHEAVAAAEAARRRRHLRRGDRPAHRRAARHGADPRVGAQDEPAADRARGRRPVRHRRRDRRDRRARRLLGSRRADPTHRCRADSAALRARPRTRVAPRPRRHRRSHPPPRARLTRSRRASTGTINDNCATEDRRAFVG